jgi:hypothetical protein
MKYKREEDKSRRFMLIHAKIMSLFSIILLSMTLFTGFTFIFLIIKRAFSDFLATYSRCANVI